MLVLVKTSRVHKPCPKLAIDSASALHCPIASSSSLLPPETAHAWPSLPPPNPNQNCVHSRPLPVTHLGGGDFDNHLVNFIQEFKHKNKLDLSLNPCPPLSVHSLQGAKCTLSSATQTSTLKCLPQKLLVLTWAQLTHTFRHTSFLQYYL